MGFRLTEDEAWDFIARAHTSHVTTLRRDGRPITIPVWHVALDRRVYVSSPSSSKKLNRVRNDPRAFFVVETGEAWGELVAVTFEARASIVEDPELAERVSAAVKEKYAAFAPPLDKLPEQVVAYYNQREIIELEPVGRISSWNNSALVAS